jgi:hypothetical protein
MEGTGKKIAKRVLDYDGPLVVTNLLQEKFSSSTRPTPAEVRESMESLEADCLGHVVKSGATVAFLKEVPSKVEETSITKHGVSKDDYRKSFFKINMDISNKLRDRIKANNEFACAILNATEDDDSEQSDDN